MTGADSSGKAENEDPLAFLLAATAVPAAAQRPTATHPEVVQSRTVLQSETVVPSRTPPVGPATAPSRMGSPGPDVTTNDLLTLLLGAESPQVYDPAAVDPESWDLELGNVESSPRSSAAEAGRDTAPVHSLAADDLPTEQGPGGQETVPSEAAGPDSDLLAAMLASPAPRP